MRVLSKCLQNSIRLGAVTASLGNLFQCSTVLWVKNLFLTYNLNIPWHILLPFPWVLSSVTREKRTVPAPPPPLVRKLQTTMRSPLSLLSSRRTSQVTLAASHTASPRNPSPTSWPSSGHSLVVYILDVPWCPKLHTVLKVRLHQCRVEWDNHLFQPASNTVLDAPQDTLGLLGLVEHSCSTWC